MIQQKEQKQARQAARSAVRAYAKNPTNSNADEVHAAWTAVWEMDEASFREKWIDTTMTVRTPIKSLEDKQ